MVGLATTNVVTEDTVARFLCNIGLEDTLKLQASIQFQPLEGVGKGLL